LAVFSRPCCFRQAKITLSGSSSMSPCSTSVSSPLRNGNDGTRYRFWAPSEQPLCSWLGSLHFLPRKNISPATKSLLSWPCLPGFKGSFSQRQHGQSVLDKQTVSFLLARWG